MIVAIVLLALIAFIALKIQQHLEPVASSDEALLRKYVCVSQSKIVK